MPLIQRKQVKAFFASRVYVAGYTTPSALSSFSANATLTPALLSAGRNGGVPLQSYVADTQQGLLVSGRNIVEIYDNATKKKLDDGTAAKNEVYGRLTFTTSYTITFYSMVGGVETLYTMPSGTVIDYAVPYIYTFDALPEDALLGVKSTYVNDDPQGGGTRIAHERLTVLAANTLSTLTNNYAGNAAKLYVNGQMVSNIDSTNALNTVNSGIRLTVGSNVIFWNQTIVGYNLATTDDVEIEYQY